MSSFPNQRNDSSSVWCKFLFLSKITVNGKIFHIHLHWMEMTHNSDIGWKLNNTYAMCIMYVILYTNMNHKSVGAAFISGIYAMHPARIFHRAFQEQSYTIIHTHIPTTIQRCAFLEGKFPLCITRKSHDSL